MTALLVAGAAAVALMAPAAVTAAEGDPVITPFENLGRCNGVLPTPGSENTLKRFVEGDLVPGGTATYEISFPVDPLDVGDTFTVVDCLFVGDDAVAGFDIEFVPNNEAFLLTITLDIPGAVDPGDELCNVAQTTGGPSDPQQSNRKAGPACITIESPATPSPSPTLPPQATPSPSPTQPPLPATATPTSSPLAATATPTEAGVTPPSTSTRDASGRSGSSPIALVLLLLVAGTAGLLVLSPARRGRR